MGTRSARREALRGALLCLGLFGGLALLAGRARGTLTSADQVLGRAPYRLATGHPGLARLAEAVEWITMPDHVVLAGLLLGAVLALAGALRRAALAASVPLLADRLYPVLKDQLARPRPEHADPLHSIGGWSFPSGHATVAGAFVWTAMVLTVAVIADPALRRRVLQILTLAVVVVGLDRLVLGVHYFSDVLAGLVLAGAITLGAAAVLDPYRGTTTARGIKSVRDRLTPAARRAAVVDAGAGVLLRAGDGAGDPAAGMGSRPRSRSR